MANWGWILDLTEGNMVLTEGKMFLRCKLQLRVKWFPRKWLVNKRNLMS